MVAITCGSVGVFTVIRGQSFAGEALGDIGTSGGSGAYLLGVGPLWGFAVAAVAGVAVMELIGIQRPRGRDLATGIVLGAGLGLAALFLYLDTVSEHHDRRDCHDRLRLDVRYREQRDPVGDRAERGRARPRRGARPAAAAELDQPRARGGSRNPGPAGRRGLSTRARARGRARRAYTIGAILSTALLVGPAATALRLTRSPGRAIALAGAIGIVAAWLGILLAYDSYDWPPVGQGWPVSFFVVTLILLGYLLAGVAQRLRRRTARDATGAHR